jgi:hypothetical protein
MSTLAHRLVALPKTSRGIAPRRRSTVARASGVVPQYGDAVFDAATRDAFNSGDAFVADAEQARVIWDDGWDF